VPDVNLSTSIINLAVKLIVSQKANEFDVVLLKADIKQGLTNRIHNELNIGNLGSKEHLNLKAAFVDETTLKNIVGRGGKLDIGKDNLVSYSSPLGDKESPDMAPNILLIL
jgi:hypothetical protein